MTRMAKSDRNIEFSQGNPTHTSCVFSDTLVGDATLDGLEFTAGYSDSTSDKYNHLKKEFCQKVLILYSSRNVIHNVTIYHFYHHLMPYIVSLVSS